MSREQLLAALKDLPASDRQWVCDQVLDDLDRVAGPVLTSAEHQVLLERLAAHQKDPSRSLTLVEFRNEMRELKSRARAT